MAKLEIQKQGLIDQANFLDAQAGKHDVIAAKAEQTNRLTADQSKELADINAELDKRALANESLTEQTRDLNAALDEQIRKAAERTGLDAETISGLRTQRDIQAAFPGLTAAQNLELTKGILLITQAEDARDKVQAKAEAAVKKEADAYDKNLGIIADTNAKLSEQKVKLDDLKASDRPNKSQEILTLERQITAELNKQKEAQEALKKIEADRTKRKEEANPEAVKKRDEIKADLDSDKLDPSRDYTAEELQARADRRAPLIAKLQEQQRIIDGLDAPKSKPAIDRADPNFQRLNLGGNPSDYTQDRGGLFPTNRPDDPPDTSRDTGPLSDANFEETAQSARDLKAAIGEGLGKVTEAVSTAAGEVPTQVAPVVTGIGGLGTAYGKAFNTVAGAVDQQAGQVEALIATAANLVKRVAAAEKDIGRLQTQV